MSRRHHQFHSRGCSEHLRSRYVVGGEIVEVNDRDLRIRKRADVFRRAVKNKVGIALDSGVNGTQADRIALDDAYWDSHIATVPQISHPVSDERHRYVSNG